MICTRRSYPVLLVVSLFLPLTAVAASQRTERLVQTIEPPALSDIAAPTVVLDASPGGIEAAAFSPDGTTILLETRRGPETPIELRQGNPNTPLYEMDVRFLDSDGFPFLVMIGGHQPVDPTWLIVPPDNGEITAERAAAQYAAAAALLKAIESSEFATTPLTKQWAPEREALLHATSAVAAVNIKDDEEPPAGTASSARLQPRANATTTTTNIYYWRVEIHKQPAGWWFDPFADHSATRTRSYSKAGVIQQTVNTNNHGAWSQDMPLSCTSVATPAVLPKALPAAPVCSTPYGYVAGKHVCNDDSYIQYKTVRDMMCVDPSAGTCSDATLRNRAPQCW